jgi:hypothetical protein
MSITEIKNAFVDPTAVSIGLSQMFGVTAGNNDPAYLVLTVLDRNEYTAGATGATGSLSGNGHTLKLSSFGGDARGSGIVFTYQASNGRYYNSTYGYLDQLTYNSSGSANDVTNLSLFGTNNLSQATYYAANAYSMMQVDPSGYLGSATVVTQPGSTGIVPVQATPDSIVAAADSFVGDSWNMNGCWVLASTIAADAGASLPVQSTLIGLPGQANGEWIVAFNGPAGQSGNWQSLVKAGEIVVIGTPGGGGHITTIVSGSGATAMLVDNVEYVNSAGQIQNAAHDGSSSDLIIAAPHAASQEWAGVLASSVVIYELDTPIVTDKVAADSLAAFTSQSLGSLFAVTDPANRAITEWQVYDTAGGDSLVLNGTSYSDHSASSALTATSLAAVALLAGSGVTADVLDVRAFNGLYWGDWQSLAVSILAVAPSAPVLEAQTPNQTWNGGATVSLVLPASVFHDPQNEALTYSATQSNGQALPSWLSFNAATETFSGTAPAAAQSLSIKVTATDSSGLAASESFTASVQPAAPIPIPPPARPGISVSNATPNQTWTDGQTVNLVLPSNTFTDALGLKMTFAAYELSGPSVTSWLRFSPATDQLYGTVPATASGTVMLEVIATDAQHMTAVDLFSVTFAPSSGHTASGATAGTIGLIGPLAAFGIPVFHS